MAEDGPIIIVGSEGNIGRRLKLAFPNIIGIDRAPGANIAADLATPDYDAPDIRTASSKRTV